MSELYMRVKLGLGWWEEAGHPSQLLVEVVNTAPYAVWHAIQLHQPLGVRQLCMVREKDAAAG